VSAKNAIINLTGFISSPQTAGQDQQDQRRELCVSRELAEHERTPEQDEANQILRMGGAAKDGGEFCRARTKIVADKWGGNTSNRKCDAGKMTCDIFPSPDEVLMACTAADSGASRTF
jgi:hypothetical protein